MNVKILVLLFVVCIIPGELFSQYHFNVKSFSLGRTSVSNLYATDAFNNNPANIQRQRYTENARFHINALTGGGYMWHSNYFDIPFYEEYFVDNENKILTDANKLNLIDKAHNSETSFMFSWNMLSFVFNTKKAGTFGISVDDRGWGNFLANRDFLDLIFFGNQKERTYDLSGTDFHTSIVRQINVSYANKFKSPDRRKYGDFYYGFSVKPMFGLYYAELDNNNFSLYTNDSNRLFPNGTADIYYSGLVSGPKQKLKLGGSPAGFGLGFDLGMGMKFKDLFNLGTFDFGLSLVDLGYINWYKNAGQYLYSGGYVITDITEEGQLDSLENLLEGNKVDDGFTRMLPMVVKFGFTYRLCLKDINQPPQPGKEKLELIGISVEYIQGLTEVSGGCTNPMLAVGTEINPWKFLSTRLGLSWGGREKFSVSAGLGFDFGPVIIDVGTYNIQSIYQPTTSSKVSAGAAIKFRIY